MKIHFFDRHLRQVHRTFIHIFIICCIQRRDTCFRTTALTFFVNFWPLSFVRLKLCWHIWMHWFLSYPCLLIGVVSGLVTGIIFSFPFLSLSRSDFGSQAGRVEQQHVISLCLSSLQGLQADKKKSELPMSDRSRSETLGFFYLCCWNWTRLDINFIYN